MKSVKSLLVFSAVAIALVLFPAISAAQGVLFVQDDKVGIGTEAPTVPLHILGTNGQMRIERVPASPSSATGLMLVNTGGVRLGYLDRSTGVLWAFNNVGGNFIANAGGAPYELELEQNGDLTITGSLTTASSTVPDYVFEADYELMSLNELENFINENGHLPNIPSASTIEEQGSVNISEFQMKILEKVEELTLYTLDQEKRIEQLMAENAKLREHFKGE